MKLHLPVPKEIKDLLGDLLDKPITVAPCPPFAPSPLRPATFGVYVDDRLQIRALVCLDVALSAYAGAAIGLVPPRQANEDIAAGELSPLIKENLGEVLNIAVTLFNVPGADHLRLHAVHAVGDPMPPDVLARSLTLGLRTDLAVTVGGYGDGVIACVLTF